MVFQLRAALVQNRRAWQNAFSGSQPARRHELELAVDRHVGVILRVKFLVGVQIKGGRPQPASSSVKDQQRAK